MLIKTINIFEGNFASNFEQLANTIIAGLGLTITMVIVVLQTPGAEKLQLTIVMRRFF